MAGASMHLAGAAATMGTEDTMVMEGMWHACSAAQQSAAWLCVYQHSGAASYAFLHVLITSGSFRDDGGHLNPAATQSGQHTSSW